MRATVLVALLAQPAAALLAAAPSVRTTHFGLSAPCDRTRHSALLTSTAAVTQGSLERTALTVPLRRTSSPSMMSPAILALDALAVTLKVSWRLAFGAAAARLVLAAVEMPAIAKLLPPALANNIKARLSAIFKPNSVKASTSVAAPPAESAAAPSEEDALRAMEEALATDDAAGEDSADESESATEAAETMTPEEAEAARVAAEEFAKKAAELEAAEKEAAEKAAMEREAAERAAAAKAAEERERFRKKMEEEKAAKEAKEKAEREAKAKAKAEAEAAAEAARVAAEKALKELEAAAPANAGREEAVTKAISEVQDALEFPYQVLSLGGMEAGKASAITSAIEELEANYAPLSAETVREGLVGFWKVLATSDDSLAADGKTGYGKAYNPYADVLASYQSYSKNLPGSVLPTIQTVEVINEIGIRGDATCTVAALKGDFDVEEASPVSVTEGYRWIEFGGARQFDQEVQPRSWQCTYLSPTLRVCRDGGKVTVYGKADAAAVTGEISEFVSDPPNPNKPAGGKGEDDEEGEEGNDEMDDEDDDRPLWQKRLDAEKNSGMLDDDSGSSIP